ncbi:MAG: hypothetical protein O2865_12905 [Planctomycetota bacterium]|nr:hypothetical protein [Planctomycetota bacterium]MDA0934473.1 hypothetical protein [Planctomycetota bacterium]MDA1222746.1 hypothetical protein [Planctomycetota bacterium]
MSALRILACLVAASALTPAAAQVESDPQAAATTRIAVQPGILCRDGRVALAGLGLGNGGIELRASAVGSADGVGRFVTRGGVLVRALAEGVKLDFPSGGEVLVDPRGTAHLRDGSRTLPHPSGLRIALLDGSHVDILVQNGSGRPLREVRVQEGSTGALLWRSGRPVRRVDRGGAFVGRTLHAFGDGRSLYELADVGVAIVYEQLLGPKSVENRLPERGAVLLGDVLGRSLQEIASVAQQRAAGDPNTQALAQNLAGMAPRLFGWPHVRPDGAHGELEIPLDGGLRLSLRVPAAEPMILALHAPGDPVALCEWTTTNVTRLHLIQRNGGVEGGPRYLMRGYALNHLLDRVLAHEPTPTARARAKRNLATLGAEALVAGAPR